MTDHEWMLVFSGNAASWLKEIFESELGDLPEPLVKLMQLLQESEEKVQTAA
jgi:hypothetical protein